MSKIIRSTAISGSRKLSGELQPAAASRQKGTTADKKAGPETAAAEPRQQPPPTADAQPPAPARPQAAPDYRDGTFAADRSLIESLKAETARLQQQYDQSQQALAETTQQLQQQQRSASEAACEQGYEDGRRQGEQLWQEKLQTLDTLLADIAAYGQQQINGLDNIAVEIAYTALCRCVGERSADRDFILDTVKTVLARVTDNLPLKVRVSAAQFALLEAHKSELEQSLAAHKLELSADPRVTAGGCILETDTGSWDGRLETQLQRLKDALVAADRARSK